MRRLLWGLFQLAVMGGALYAAFEIERQEGRSLGYAPGVLAVLAAWLVTIIPFAIIEGVKDVPRLYWPAFKRWRSKPARVDSTFPKPLDHGILGRPSRNGRSRLIKD